MDLCLCQLNTTNDESQINGNDSPRVRIDADEQVTQGNEEYYVCKKPCGPIKSGRTLYYKPLMITADAKKSV